MATEDISTEGSRDGTFFGQPIGYVLLAPELENIALKGMQGYASTSWGDQSWFFPETVFYLGEKHAAGVWMRGDRGGDVVVLSAKPLSELSLVVQSLAPDGRLRLEGGSDPVVIVTFDTPAKREGTRVSIPVIAERAKPPSGPAVYLHRMRVRMQGGVDPADALPGSEDRRFLGAFLRPANPSSRQSGATP